MTGVCSTIDAVDCPPAAAQESGVIPPSPPAAATLESRVATLERQIAELTEVISEISGHSHELQPGICEQALAEYWARTPGLRRLATFLIDRTSHIGEHPVIVAYRPKDSVLEGTSSEQIETCQLVIAGVGPFISPPAGIADVIRDKLDRADFDWSGGRVLNIKFDDESRLQEDCFELVCQVQATRRKDK